MSQNDGEFMRFCRGRSVDWWSVHRIEIDWSDVRATQSGSGGEELAEWIPIVVG